MKNKKNTKNKREDGKFSFKKKVMLVFLGAIVGFINGFFGGGGGVVGVPVIEKGLGVDNKTAHASCLSLILPLSIVSSAIYIFSNTVESNLLISVGSGVIIGGMVGSLLLKILPAKIVRVIFAVILLAGGIRLILW